MPPANQFSFITLLYNTIFDLIKRERGPGWVVQLFRAPPLYAMVVGLILHQGTDKNQPMNVEMGGMAN